MAYARYDRDCDWYIFWRERAGDGQQSKREQELAVWHSSLRADGPVFTYAQVAEFLAAKDFSRIPGRSPADDCDLAKWLTEFVLDVDTEYPT